jgi:hypothetical protein
LSKIFGTKRERAFEQPLGELALFLDGLDHPGAQHFKQAWHHDHQGWARLFHIAGEFFETFGIVNLPANPDREKLPCRMFIGVAERQEGEEHLLIPTKIIGNNINAARDVLEDRTVMLAHAARRTAGAAGINDAGQIVALHRHRAGAYARHIGGLACHKLGKIVDRDIA